jgi:hypothetical protein
MITKEEAVGHSGVKMGQAEIFSSRTSSGSQYTDPPAVIVSVRGHGISSWMQAYHDRSVTVKFSE